MKINGAGSIEKRGKNVWRIRFNLGADPLTGKYRYSPWRTVHGTKADAVAALAEYRQEIESGLKLDADKITFADFANVYSEQRAALGTYAQNTLLHEKYQINHLNRYLGDMPIKEIDSLTVQNLLAALGKEGKSAGAIKRAYKTLNQIMKEALIHDVLMRNPCDKIKAPKAAKPEIAFLEGREITRFMQALDAQLEDTKSRNRTEEARSAFQHAHVIATRLALATGMRRGEVLGLSWAQIDLEEGNIKVVQQMSSSGIAKLKSEKSRRVLSLDATTLEYLQAWKLAQHDYFNGIGIKQTATTPVITNELGEWQEPRNFSRWWRNFVNTHGFKGLRFHDLRHTQATLLIGQGIDIKTVQTRLGHETASTTLDMYAGVLAGKDKAAADTIGEILFREGMN